MVKNGKKQKIIMIACKHSEGCWKIIDDGKKESQKWLRMVNYDII